MAKKRKSVAIRLDEVDRTIYSTFCTAANSLSQLYSQAINQQKVTFHAGERHGMEKVYNWILRQHEGGMRVSSGDIVAFLQNELDHGGEEMPLSPRLPPQQQHCQHNMPFISSISHGPPMLCGQSQSIQGPRAGHGDQTKNSVFSSAVSSPIRSLQPCHLAQSGGFYATCPLSSENGIRNHEMNDTSMDMHSDSPRHDSY